MSIFSKLFGSQKSHNNEVRQKRYERIATYGLELIDRRGWHEGTFAERRYFLSRDGEIVAGPFNSSLRALEVAQQLHKSEKD